MAMRIEGLWSSEFQKIVENAERLEKLWSWLMSDFYIAPELPEELQRENPDPLLDPLLAQVLDENLQTIELVYSGFGYRWADGTDAPVGTLCGIFCNGEIHMMPDFQKIGEK